VLLISGFTAIERIQYDDSKRPPTTSLDVYKDGKVPDRKYKEIAELMMPGHREDELLRQKQLIAEAKRMGGNGLIFSSAMTGGGNIFGAAGCVFKGKVIVYE